MTTAELKIGSRVQLSLDPRMTADLHGRKGTVEGIRPTLVNGQSNGPDLYEIALDQPFRMSHVRIPVRDASAMLSITSVGIQEVLP